MPFATSQKFVMTQSGDCVHVSIRTTAHVCVMTDYVCSRVRKSFLLYPISRLPDDALYTAQRTELCHWLLITSIDVKRATGFAILTRPAETGMKHSHFTRRRFFNARVPALWRVVQAADQSEIENTTYISNSFFKRATGSTPRFTSPYAVCRLTHDRGRPFDSGLAFLDLYLSMARRLSAKPHSRYTRLLYMTNDAVVSAHERDLWPRVHLSCDEN